MIHKLNARCIRLVGFVAVVVILGWCADSVAAGLFSSDDLEKPKPEFTRKGDAISAKFIPRAKSTSVTLEFQVTAGGQLEVVKAVDFATVDRPAVDIKNFKSAAFEIGIGNVARGGSATVAIRSDFFSLSTAFYVFNPKRGTPWIENAQTENRALPDRVRELIVQVRDGGDMDADGSADGHVTLIGGPRDSFWGYALGTLFIRFFGIFIVLVFLMLGMIVSGWIFKRLDRRATAAKSTGPQDRTAPAAAKQVQAPAAAETPAEQMPVAEATIAAIGAALYLRDKASQTAPSETAGMEAGTAWAVEGRKRIMNDRLMVFNAGTARHKG